MRSWKLFRRLGELHLSMRMKFALSMGAIAVTLLVSCIISIMEYTRMSDYVSSLIADDISSINVSRVLGDKCTSYNLAILALIGDETSNELPPFDDSYFRTHCDSLRNTLSSAEVRNLADSVMYSYSAYLLTSFEIEDVISSNFIDSRTWYFNRLQPRYNRLCYDIDRLSSSIHKDLQENSATFERGFYRSVIPGLVAVGVGLLMILLLLFYFLSYYVSPLSGMLKALEAYRFNGKNYSYDFEGDDELKALNEGIQHLAAENSKNRRKPRGLESKDA